MAGGAKLGKALLDVEGDFTVIQKQAAGASQDIGKSISSGLTSFGKKVVGTLAVGAAAKEVVDFTKDSVKAAAGLAGAVRGTNLVFGSAAASMDGFFKDAATNMGLTETVARRSASATGQVLVGIGLNAGQAASATETLMQRAADLGAAFSKDPTDVMNTLTAAMRGQVRGAKSLGIMIDDTTLKQKAMALGVYDGTGKLSASAKAQATLALIMEKSNNVAGTFAKTAGGLGATAKIVGAQWEEVQVTFGQALLPVLKQVLPLFKTLLPAITPIVGVLGTQLAGAFQKLVPVITRLVPIIAQLLGQLGQNLVSILAVVAPAFGQLVDAVSPLLPVLAQLATTILGAVMTAVQPLLAVMAPLVSQLARALLPAVVTLTPIFAQLGTTLAQVVVALTPLIGAAGQLLVALLPLLPPAIQLATITFPLLAKILPPLAAVISAVLTPAINGLTKAVNFIVPAITAVVGAFSSVPTRLSGVITWFRNLPGVITGALSALPGLLVSLGARMLSGFLQGISTGWGGVYNYIAGLPGRIISSLSDAGSWLFGVGKAMIEGMVNGVKAAAGGLVNAVKSVVTAPINLAKGILGIHSPSKVFYGIGVDMGRGMVLGLNAMAGPVAAATGNMLPGDFGALGADVAVGGGAPIDARLILNAPVYGLDELNSWADQRDRRLMAALTVRRV